jgi:hypothetical protein
MHWLTAVSKSPVERAIRTHNGLGGDVTWIREINRDTFEQTPSTKIPLLSGRAEGFDDWEPDPGPTKTINQDQSFKIAQHLQDQLVMKVALKIIARYGNEHGICPYGCDCPHIARSALEELKVI